MAIVVETGAIVAGANSYISVADADAYFVAHNNADWAALTTASKEAALLYAAVWLDERYSWTGSIVDQDQTLRWPRMGVYDDEWRTVSSSTIPQCIKDAQCEAAVASAAETLAEVRERGGGVQYARIDVLAVSFQKGAASGRTFPYIDSLVAKLGYPAISGILRTYR